MNITIRWKRCPGGEKINRLDLDFKEAAINAVEQARSSFGQVLDFSEESLFIVEFILEELSVTIKKKELSEKWIENIVQMYSGYIAYVMLLRWKGEWRSEIENQVKKGPALTIRKQAFFIPDQVRQRLIRGKEFSIVKYYYSAKITLDEQPLLPALVASKPLVVPPAHNHSITAGLSEETGSRMREPDEMEWVISVTPVSSKEVFIKEEIVRIFNPEWRIKAGFASGWVDIYGLPAGDTRWRLVREDWEASPEKYSRLELRCNLFRIYHGKRHLNPKYLEVYLRTVQELFAQFRFRVTVSPVQTFEEGVARVKGVIVPEQSREIV